MTAQVNIQTLFSQLQLEQFLVYLPGNGWQSAPERRDDRVRFELPGEDHPFVLLLPNSNKSYQCKKLLQRAIYNLSGIEDRQPIDIIRDILAVEARESAAPAATPEPATPAATSPLDANPRPMAAVAPPTAGAGSAVRLRLHNRDSQRMVVQVASRPGEISLQPDEAIEIVCNPREGEMLELGLKGSHIQVSHRGPR
ncbi:hypothetical protein OAS39_06490 [Pirellulales bacterium]|nr:hypothetical protein [Pirellulales bacterium]